MIHWHKYILQTTQNGVFLFFQIFRFAKKNLLASNERREGSGDTGCNLSRGGSERETNGLPTRRFDALIVLWPCK